MSDAGRGSRRTGNRNGRSNGGESRQRRSYESEFRSEAYESSQRSSYDNEPDYSSEWDYADRKNRHRHGDGHHHHHSHHSSGKHKGGGNKGLKIALIVLACLAAAALIIFAIVYFTKPKKEATPAPSGYEFHWKEVNPNITNFLIFGVNTDDSKEMDRDRSDAIMILSVNKETNTVKMVSILRDTKVDIKGYGEEKINLAYKLGGAPLAIDTINDSFGLNLRNYISVDFTKMKTLIDMIGGVDVELTEAEADIVNRSNSDSGWLTEGTNTLNGAQALSYSRIRDDSDYYRASRQQTVLEAVLHKLTTQGQQATLDNLESYMEVMDTSFFYNQLYEIIEPLNFETLEVQHYNVPDRDIDKDVFGGWVDNNTMWYWIYDLDAAGERIKSIISE